MDEKYVKAFNAVITFVHDIWDVFGNTKNPTPLALYRRLIEHIKFADSDAITKVLKGFQDFYLNYEKCILSNNLDSIDRGVVIRYGESN
jgi:hypothetical protein